MTLITGLPATRAPISMASHRIKYFSKYELLLNKQEHAHDKTIKPNLWSNCWYEVNPKLKKNSKKKDGGERHEPTSTRARVSKTDSKTIQRQGKKATRKFPRLITDNAP